MSLVVIFSIGIFTIVCKPALHHDSSTDGNCCSTFNAEKLLFHCYISNASKTYKVTQIYYILLESKTFFNCKKSIKSSEKLR